MKYSVIILLEEHEEDFPKYVQNLYNLFASRDESFEILIMANGIGGFLRNVLAQLNSLNDKLKAFEFSAKTSEAVCLRTALKESNGQIVVACGSFEQITKDSFVHLLESLDEKTDFISPWRHQRVDSRLRRFRSKAFNALVRKITKTDLHDLNCRVKIFRREVLEETELYGNMYRYLPILAAHKGFKIKEVRCEHSQEHGGKSGVANIPEYFARIIDILTLYFNTRFTKKPLRFFSTIGLGFILAGFFITFYVFLQRFFVGHPIGDRPILLLAILLMVLGVQAASVGLLGEIIVFTHGRKKKEYTIEKTI